ncbi:hypothetical protein C6P46_006364 [Rhodotorula mucilaginosa]|uniref:Bud22 domain-containing protein n=1 Tax=Rhodotorula mucilaginosa TaxID=5537 RepID=A0A9P7B9H0_RHOMI|nr:hypothetical protein C6P46_006364 [Rhodotorula mucilaginosa]
MSTRTDQKRSRPNGNAGNKSQNKRWQGANQQHDEEGQEADPVAQEQALKAYMHHAVKLLHKAVKKSKTFEVQKLTRKVKQTKEPKDGKADEALAKDLDAQLSALKKLDINAIPPHLLANRIAKLGPLRSVPYLPYLIATIPQTPAWVEYEATSAEAKARNRILANKAVGEAWDEIVRAVRKRLGEEVEPKEGGKGKGKADEEVPRKGMTMDPGRQAAIEAAFLQGAGDDEDDEHQTHERIEAVDDADEETSEDEGPVAGFSSGEEESEMDDDEAIQRELAALGGDDSDSEGGWSGSEDDEDAIGSDADSAVAAEPASKKRRKLSASPPPAPPSKKAKAAAAAAAAPGKPITSSSFLPSLAAGYISYSDSDGEEARWIKDEERKDKKDKRKNRRGQRARQAIWEKKYGSAAAHVVKANGGKPVPLAKVKEQKAKRAERQRNAPPGPAAPAYDAPNAEVPPPPRRHQFQEPKADVGWKKREEVKAAEAAAEKVHPSWEAKRKAAEALKQSAALKPQGKKITFD